MSGRVGPTLSHVVGAELTRIRLQMAHHMLYQAMEENPCAYDGYLWAPFDAFLNVPRLQQFDKTRFWYHSPWAKYVYNPATAASQDTRHAPPLGPASPAPDPYPANPADLYKYDWWCVAFTTCGLRELKHMHRWG